MFLKKVSMAPMLLIQHGIFYIDSVGCKGTLSFPISDLALTPAFATPDAMYFHSGVREGIICQPVGFSLVIAW
jgi:hypothetical protein